MDGDRGGHFLEDLDDSQVDELQGGELPDESELWRRDRAGKHLTEFWAERIWDGKRVEPEDESQDARAKSERRERESRMEDGTARIVLVSELAILFACEAGERRRPEEFAESANSHRGLPADFVRARASNYFSVRIRFA